MIEHMIKSCKWIFLFIALFIALCWFESQYAAIRKYYPGMSRWEYFMLQDKIRITPKDG